MLSQATFNPQILNSTKAQGVVVDFDPLCFFHPRSDECVQVLFFCSFFALFFLLVFKAGSSQCVLEFCACLWLASSLNPKPETLNSKL